MDLLTVPRNPPGALDARREPRNFRGMHPGKTLFPAMAGAAWLAGVLGDLPNHRGLRAAGAELVASAEPGWPQFRGPRRDGVSDERGLLGAWPEGGLRLLWKAEGLGKGFSSPVIAGGRLFITGDFGEEVRVLAFDLEGKPLWSARNGDAWLNQYQGARASVAARAGRVYHQNAHGRVVCLDRHWGWSWQFGSPTAASSVSTPRPVPSSGPSISSSVSAERTSPGG